MSDWVSSFGIPPVKNTYGRKQTSIISSFSMIRPLSAGNDDNSPTTDSSLCAGRKKQSLRLISGNIMTSDASEKKRKAMEGSFADDKKLTKAKLDFKGYVDNSHPDDLIFLNDQLRRFEIGKTPSFFGTTSGFVIDIPSTSTCWNHSSKLRLEAWLQHIGFSAKVVEFSHKVSYSYHYNKVTTIVSFILKIVSFVSLFDI
jgi:hypothetical protein